ncbi:hypothetical protein RND71_022426 [Anisodus tanguticus]|uniref:Pectinesterase inhibitor domain-containing protein n=1 Tax=Anisodus tanguticus TaxID=243964 RepID=A0AAE1VAQ7_9SOLA|nr:hypothetical protein RND71_022426 [Anisodus tanguticus]
MALISFSMSRRSNSFIVKLIPLAFVFCLTLQLPIANGRIQIQSLNIIPPNLVKACNNNNECISWIQKDRSKADLDSLQKADLKTIGFLALKKIEQEATNVSITVRLKLLNNSAQLSSDTQQALSDCNDHFIPAIELIDDAVDATVNGAFNDAINYYTTAITDFEVCYPHLKAMRTSNAVDVNDYVDNHIAEVANARNNLVKFIHIPLDILKVVAANSPH